MAEFSKVRLVFCPKCENLLPELPHISLYRCGGCGAVLQAKNKGIGEDGLVEVSDDLKYVQIPGEGSLVEASEVEMERIGRDRVERQSERGDSSSYSTSRAQSRELPVDSDVNMRGRERIRRLLHLGEEEYMSYPGSPVHGNNRGMNPDMNVDRREYNNSPIRHPRESVRSRAVMDQRGFINNGSEIYHQPGEPARRIISERMYDNIRYQDGRPLTYNMNSYYGHEHRREYPSHNLDGVDTIESLEHSRAELMQKLDDLKDELSRSCDLGDMSNERFGTHRRVVSPSLADPYNRNHGVYFQEHVNRSRGVSPDDLGAPYSRQNPGFTPYMDRYDTFVRDSYPQSGYSHGLMGYADPYQPDFPHRPHRSTQSQHMHQPHHGHFSGYGGDVNLDVMLQRHENHFNHPACSCLHCHNRNWGLPPNADPSGSYNLQSRNEPSSPIYRSQNPPLHRTQKYGSGSSTLPSFHSRQSSPPTLRDRDRKTDGFNSHLPSKVVATHTNGKMRHPVAGGAPFVTCSYCFELLGLPRKHISPAKRQQKIKCGACSSIMIFDLGNKGLVLSASARVEEVPTEIDDVATAAGDENVKYLNGGSNSTDMNTYDDVAIGTVDENVKNLHGSSNTADMNTCSNDHNETELKLSPIKKASNSGEFEKQVDPRSLPSSLSEEEERPKDLPSEKHDSPPAALPIKQLETLSQPDSSSQECIPKICSDNFIPIKSEKGTKGEESEPEPILLERAISRQNSVKEAAMATEMDVSLNDYSNSCVSHDSVEISKDDHQGTSRRGSKSLREFAESNQIVEDREPQVYVNGHLIPDSVVTRAERLAGPIQPGEYWYDIQAGFWGVMGHPCLGIIMPHIEEFNYPIPEYCAAGNTGVFVNGRELHQKDLDLLATRGLPTTKHRSYIVEISGEVVDVHTGVELDSLGTLAPTVERAQQGFGMRVPRFIAQLQS